MKQLALTSSGNLLVCLYPSLVLFQHTSRKLKSPKRSRACDPKISSSSSRKALPSFSCQLSGHKQTATRLNQILITCPKPQVLPCPAVCPLKNSLYQSCSVTYPHPLVSLPVFTEDLVSTITALQLCELSQSPRYSIVQFLFTSQTEETQPGPPCP